MEELVGPSFWRKEDWKLDDERRRATGKQAAPVTRYVENVLIVR